ncbi:MAG TPA: hypothetical protein VM865_04600, partial [Acidobacteriaceae bacterium]|nr:hypothetical protein [Acidobacteriaceae bacterium]
MNLGRTVIAGGGLWVGLLGVSSGEARAGMTPLQDGHVPAPIERQAPEGQMPTLRLESRLVGVALNVVDEKGAPVSGLTVNDFELAEDGKPQRIAVFDKESATPLQIVLAIDASESVLRDEHLEREAAKSFVRSILRPQDSIDLIA